MFGSVLKLQMLLFVGLVNGQSFICNNYKNIASCEGSTASDGICSWGLFGCTATQPLPSPIVAPTMAPPVVCPAYTAEASCVYNPCTISQGCFSNFAAKCVINPCVGEFEYLGATLHKPCSAVYVDVEAMEVVNCNVKEVIREADPDAVRPGADTPETKSVNGEAATGDIVGNVDDTRSVAGPTLGLAPETPAPILDDTVPSVGLPSLSIAPISVATAEDEEVAVGKTPLDAFSNLNDLMETSPAVEEEEDNN